MTNEIATQPEKREDDLLSILVKLAPEGIDGKALVKLIKNQLLASKKSTPTNEELMYFMTVCNQSGLNPMRNEIYGIYRGGKLTIQSSIDGLRAVAERSGKYAGSDEPVFKNDENGSLMSATVTVKKVLDGIVIPTTRTALWQEYYSNSSSNPIVKKMPTVMLAKCAEAQALRAAFPNTGQIYTEEEMIQAETITPVKADTTDVKSEVEKAKAKLLEGATK
jgi:phage recombination protein Bet